MSTVNLENGTANVHCESATLTSGQVLPHIAYKPYAHWRQVLKQRAWDSIDNVWLAMSTMRPFFPASTALDYTDYAHDVLDWSALYKAHAGIENAPDDKLFEVCIDAPSTMEDLAVEALHGRLHTKQLNIAARRQRKLQLKHTSSQTVPTIDADGSAVQ